MKKFKFKLHPLLKYRAYQEKVARQKTARAHMDVENCRQQIVELEQTWDQQADSMEEMVTKGVPASRFHRYHQYLTVIETGIEQEKVKKAQLETVLQKKLVELKKKSVKKRTMELYEEKLRDAYTREMLQMEQKELDEISILKTARRLRTLEARKKEEIKMP